MSITSQNMQKFKKILLISVLIIFTSNNQTFASKTVDPMILKQFSTIFTGWYLSERCKIFSKRKRTEFKWYVTKLSLYMYNRTENENGLRELHKKSKIASHDERLKKCGTNSKKIMDLSFALGKDLSYFLTKKRYVKDN